MKLNKEDWKKLDDLLSKIGFGGYYDLVECLKMILRDLSFENWEFPKLLEKETDIYNLVNLIMKIQKRLKEVKRGYKIVK